MLLMVSFLAWPLWPPYAKFVGAEETTRAHCIQMLDNPAQAGFRRAVDKTLPADTQLLDERLVPVTIPGL